MCTVIFCNNTETLSRRDTVPGLDLSEFETKQVMILFIIWG